MFKCLNEDCNHTFDQPAKQYDSEGDYIEVCPYCEYDELVQISICVKCGELARYFESLCDGCKGLIRDTLKAPIDFLMVEYGFDARDIEEEFTKLIEGEEKE